MTSLVKSSNEVANITAPFLTSADHNGLSHLTQLRTYFPLGKQALHVVNEASIRNTRQYFGSPGADAAVDYQTLASKSSAAFERKVVKKKTLHFSLEHENNDFAQDLPFQLLGKAEAGKSCPQRTKYLKQSNF